MKKHLSKNIRSRRHARVRAKVAGTAVRPRLSVFKSNKYIYGALIDDVTGATLAAASDRQGGGKAKGESPFVKVNSAKAVGEALAKIAKDKKISKAVFDRGGYRYAGRVQALAEGARAGGLEF